MKHRILIFTKYDRIESLLGETNPELNKFSLIKDNKVIGYDTSTLIFKSDEGKYEIYLLRDDITGDEVSNLLNKLDSNDNFIALHHNATVVKNDFPAIFANKKSKIIEGHHINGVANHYEPIYNILLNNEKNKTQLILEHFDIDGDFLRNDKLKFLNSIYNGNTDVEIPEKLKGKINEALYDPLKNYSYNKDLDRPDTQAYLDATEDVKTKHDEMREALKILRDAVLQITG